MDDEDSIDAVAEYESECSKFYSMQEMEEEKELPTFAREKRIEKRDMLKM